MSPLGVQPEADFTQRSPTRFDGKAALAVMTLLQFPGLGLAAGMAAREWRTAVSIILVITTTGAALCIQLGSEVSMYALATIAVCLGGILYDTRAANRFPSYLAHAALGAIIGFSIYSIWMYSDPDMFSPFWQEIRRPSAVIAVQQLALIAAFSFIFGMTAFSRLLNPLFGAIRRLIEDLEPASESQEAQFSRGFFFLAGGLFVISLASRGVGYFGRKLDPSIDSALGLLSFLYYAALYQLNARGLSTRTGLRTLLAIDAVALAYELISGSKGRFATFILFPLIVINIFYQRRLTLRQAAAVGGIVIGAVFIVYPLLVEYRAEIMQTGDTSEATVSDVDKTAGRFESARSRWADRYSDKLLKPILESNVAEQVVAATSIVHYNVRMPNQPWLTRLAFFWVPRALWPSKPVALSANVIGRESHRLNEGDETTSVLQTGIGELYALSGLDGAWGMAIAGFVCRLIDTCFSPFAKRTPLRVGVGMFFVILIPQVVTGAFESTITGMLTWLVLLIVVLTVFKLLRRRTAAHADSTDLAPVNS